MTFEASTTKDDIESTLHETGPPKANSPLFPSDSSGVVDLMFQTKNEEECDRHKAGGNGLLGKLQRMEGWLDNKMGIETQGVDRIPEADKVPPSVFNMFLMWWSLTCHVGALPMGMLGPDFGLTFRQCLAAIIIGAFLGSACSASCGTLGPKLGLRAIATARYSFGFYGAKVCSLINIVTGAGYATVNAVVVGQLLSSVTEQKLSPSIGCILIGVLSYVISIFGFKVIHSYVKYAWIGSFIVLCILLGQICSKVDISRKATQTGLPHVGAFLSFLTINFSSSATWGTVAADYFCNYPANTPKWKIYFLMIFGIVLPTSFTAIVGACLGNIAFNVTSETGSNLTSYAYPVFAEAYHDHGLGGILRVSYYPDVLSRIILTLLSFSVLANNIVVNYSVGLSFQLLGDCFHAVPRFIWSLLIAILITVLAVIGRENLSNIVANFVSMLGYWAISFTLILGIEDGVFRRRSGYNLDYWNVPSKLPWGIAAMAALLVSYLAGGLTGMSQSLYVGPIARKFGGNGGDVGVILSGLFTLIIYPIVRFYELKAYGK
ncbi:Purine-cytosine permease FCY22 [Erysiphe necator]|nr:Purine-cytosine permease FCY22 [Erysiphe necator]